MTTHCPPQKNTLTPPSPTGNEEKENTPIATTPTDNGHRSISKNTTQYIDSLEDQENISTSKY
jgi:hypothetical protein